MIIPATLDDPTAQWKDLGLPIIGGERSPKAVDVIADILNPPKPRYLAKRDPKTNRVTTYCNILVQDFTRLADCWIPHTYDVTTGDPVSPDHAGKAELRANEIPGWMENFGERRGWRDVKTEAEARDLVERLGLIAIFCWVNPNPLESGHTGVVVPGGICQAGETCYRRAMLDKCLSPSKQASTRWFAHA